MDATGKIRIQVDLVEMKLPLVILSEERPMDDQALTLRITRFVPKI